MNTFIVKTENPIAANMVCRAIKAVDNNEAAHALYKKACIALKTGKLVITNLAEMEIWKNAIKAYKPATKAEGKIYRVIAARAVRGLDKRSAENAALARAC